MQEGDILTLVESARRRRRRRTPPPPHISGRHGPMGMGHGQTTGSGVPRRRAAMWWWDTDPSRPGMAESGRIHPNLPLYCETPLQEDHPCSCAVVDRTYREYHFWRDYPRLPEGMGSHESDPIRTSQEELQRLTQHRHCATCGVQATWFPTFQVVAGESRTTSFGITESTGIETSHSVQEEIANTVAMSSGFEFEGCGMSMDVATTASLARSFSMTMSSNRETNRGESRTINFQADGQVWQPVIRVNDTCGRHVYSRTEQMAVTPLQSRPVCFPGSCMTSGLNSYCCTCLGGEEQGTGRLPGVEDCDFPPCPPHATVGFSPFQHFPLAEVGCGRRLEPDEECTADCATAGGGLTGSIRVKCSPVDGSVSIVGSDCDLTS